MMWQRIKVAILAATVLAAMGFEARANGLFRRGCCPTACESSCTGGCGSSCGNAGGCGDACAAPAAPCAPAMRTIRVMEMDHVQVPVTVTKHRTEQRQENYTAYKTEMVPETRTRTCTVYHRVTETVMKNVTECVKVPCTETRTCMVTKCCPVQETVMKTRCVDKGHWDCKEVCCAPAASTCGGCGDACGNSSGGRRKLLGGLFHRHGCGSCCKSSCGDSCGNSCGSGCGDACGNSNNCCAPATTTVRVWVPNMVQEQYSCCVTRMVSTQVPHTYTVTTCKTEMRCKQVPCCVTKCVPECKTQTYTVCVAKCTPYQACRTVCVCVPYTETCMVTKCCPRWVEKQVPCEQPCANTCCHSDNCCNHDDCCGKRAGLFSRLKGKFGSRKCGKSCGGCGSSCGSTCCN